MSNYVFYDNYDLDDLFEETKKELLDSETYTEDELTDDVVWNCVYDIDAENFDNIFQEIKNWADNNQVLFIGSVGRWNGTFAGSAIGDFSTLFTEAIKDCDYFKIWEEDKVLNLTLPSVNNGNPINEASLNSLTWEEFFNVLCPAIVAYTETEAGSKLIDKTGSYWSVMSYDSDDN